MTTAARGGATAGPPGVPGGTPRPAPASWSAGRITALVVGALLTLLSLGLLPSGAVLLWADAAQRDSDGYLVTAPRSFGTDTAALVAEPFEVELGTTAEAAWLRGTLGRVRLSAEQPEPGAPLFVGLGPTADVDAYLAGVAHDRVREARFGRGTRYSRAEGELRPASPPESQDFWVASSSGPSADLSWTMQEGTWTVVVMRADGQPEVAADVRVGATLPVLPWAAAGLLVLGGVFLAGGVVLLVAAAATGSRRDGPPPVLPGPRTWSPQPSPGPSSTRQHSL